MTSIERIETEVDGDRVIGEQAGTGDQVVLCVHGLGSQRASLLPLVEVLAERGFRALAPDLRGHGESQGHRGRISRGRALEDLQAWGDRLEQDETQIRAIVGHSLGGFWAMGACEPLDADAIAIVATPASIRRELNALERILYRFGAWLQTVLDPLDVDLKIPYQVDLEEVLETEEAIQTARRIELVQTHLPLANAGDLLALEGTRMAARVDVPAIVAHPSRDRLVGEASTRALYESLAGPRRWLELDGPHECFFDVDGRDAARELSTALEEELDDGGSRGSQEGDEPDDRQE